MDFNFVFKFLDKFCIINKLKSILEIVVCVFKVINVNFLLLINNNKIIRDKC